MNQITKRCWTLLALLLVGFSCVFLIPASGEFAYSMLDEKLPANIKEYQGFDQEISDLELEVLANDTTFARKKYYNTQNYTIPPKDISVVFSGKDINNSLHRPEVCLIAQGWNFISEKYITYDGAMPDGSDLSLKEIVCQMKLEDGRVIKKVQYYTFFGSDDVVSGHYERTWADIKNRLLKGQDQQWAYVTFSMSDLNGYRDQYGEVVEYTVEVEECKTQLEAFIRSAMPHVIRDK